MPYPNLIQKKSILIILFAYKTRLNFKAHPLLVLALPILLIGFVGGTIYHATRSNSLWLFMDFIPIFVLALSASIFFWYKFFGSWLKALLTFALLFIFTFILRKGVAQVAPSLAISVGYSSLAILILLPAFLVSRKHHWLGIKLLASSIFLFIIAITCRTLDKFLGAQI